jgi:hypothetical protein
VAAGLAVSGVSLTLMAKSEHRRLENVRHCFKP